METVNFLKNIKDQNHKDENGKWRMKKFELRSILTFDFPGVKTD